MLGGMDRKELTKYVTISQVGLEMVVPVGVGVLVDKYMDWSPWGVTVGAVLGLTVGLIHLVKLANKEDEPKEKPESPP